MIINGEKWACEACVRGHRVSNCQHSDRPLQHINKKGRPVSQCQHCRAMRKSRSAHIKCDCGEKSSKCVHLQTTVEGHSDTCCCNHGKPCTCAGKVDQPRLDTVPETDARDAAPQRSKNSIRRRRANTAQSDGMLTFDDNGNHKSIHKHNRVMQTGSYPLHRVESTNSSGAGSLTDGGELYTAQGRIGDSSDTFPRAALHAREQRQVRSETGSPFSSGSSSMGRVDLPPLDMSAIAQYPSYMAGSSGTEPLGAGFSSDYDAPQWSAGLASSVDWSMVRAGDGFSTSGGGHTGAQSYGSGWCDYGSATEPVPRVAMSNPAGGAASEVDDLIAADGSDFDGFGRGSGMVRQAGPYGSTSDMSSVDSDYYRGYGGRYVSGQGGSALGESGVNMIEDDPVFNSWGADYQDELSRVTGSPDPMTGGMFWDSAL